MVEDIMEVLMSDFFDWTAAQSRALVARLRGEKSDPPLSTAVRRRKQFIDVCVVRHGTCVTHGNSADTCATDRAP